MKKQIIFTAILLCCICFAKANTQKDNDVLCQTIYCFATNGSNIFTGTWDGGVFLSSNNGSSWIPINKGLSYYYVYSLAISGSNIFAGTGRGMFISSDNGGSWEAINTGLPFNTSVKSIAISGDNIFIGTRGSGVFVSTSNGDRWYAVNTGLLNYNVNSLAISGSNIYAGTYGGGVFLSTNNGNSWTAINNGLLGLGSYVNVLAVSGSNVFAGTTTGMYLSLNNGSSWTAVNNGLRTNTSIQSLAISNSNIFAGTYSGEIYLSTNNGSNWSLANNGLPANTGVSSLLVSGANIFAGTNNKGVYISSNNGASWVEGNSGLTKLISMANTTAEMANWDKYPTYDVYEAMMLKFQMDYPNLFKRYELVTLSSGRKLIVGKLTSNVNTKVAKPQFLYSSTMHGKEPTGFVTLLRFIDYLLKNYTIDSKVSNIVDNIELWILPLSNPDGAYYGGNSNISGAVRYNANLYDLNRNYPSPAIGAHPDGSIYQPETQTLMNFADSMNFVMAANFHSGHENFYFPWDSWTSSRKHADDDWWRMVGKEFADSCQKYGPLNGIPSYFTEHPSGIIEGGDEGILYGTRADYMTYFKHCREATIEISYTYMVGSDLLPNYWYSLYRSILNYPRETLNGIRGFITDSCTGKPIKAKVFIQNHDTDNSWVYSNPKFGDYYRPIKGGIWSVTYSSEGYQPKTIYNIECRDGESASVDVKLLQDKPLSDFTFSMNRNIVTFLNSSFGGTSYFWDFGDGTSSSIKNPTHTFLSNGPFLVQLEAFNDCGESSKSQKSINLSVEVNSQSYSSNRIEVTPNPTSSSITINIYTKKYEKATIVISDITGNVFFNKNIQLVAGENYYVVDLSDKNQKIFLVRIATPTNSIVYKIMKNN